MILPLKDLLEYNGNRYVLSVAAMKRANQLINNPRLIPKDNKRKVVSTALDHVLNKNINHTVPDIVHDINE